MTSGVSSPDILIVGGGLLGCATAWHLARQGMSVRLIERGDLNSGASGQNAGSLHFQIERRFLEQGEDAAADAARIVSLNRLAIAEWSGLEDALARPLDIAMHGGLMVAETEAEMRLLAFKVEREQALGLSTQLIDAAELRARAPYLAPHLQGAAWLAEEGHANPRILARAFAEQAQAAGATIETGVALTGLTMDSNGHYRVACSGRTGAGTITSPRILLASGHWSARIASRLGLNLPLYAVPLMMNVTERGENLLPYLVQHVGQRLSMKQSEDGNFLIGGGWPSRFAARPDGLPDLDRPGVVVPENLAANLAIAARVLPYVGSRSLLRTWTGTTCISADQLPLVGEVRAAPGLHVAAGGSLFTLGPVLARLLAQSILSGQPAEELSMFLPDRFAHLNAFAVLP